MAAHLSPPAFSRLSFEKGRLFVILSKRSASKDLKKGT